jgi:hypothetical protein
MRRLGKSPLPFPSLALLRLHRIKCYCGLTVQFETAWPTQPYAEWLDDIAKQFKAGQRIRTSNESTLAPAASVLNKRSWTSSARYEDRLIIASLTITSETEFQEYVCLRTRRIFQPIRPSVIKRRKFDQSDVAANGSAKPRQRICASLGSSL